MSLWRKAKEHEHWNSVQIFQCSENQVVCPFLIEWSIRSSWLHYHFLFQNKLGLFYYFIIFLHLPNSCTNFHYNCWNFNIEIYQNSTDWKLICPKSTFLLHYSNIHKVKDQIAKPSKIHCCSYKIHTIRQKFTPSFQIVDVLATGLSKNTDLNNLLQWTRELRISRHILIKEEHIFEFIVCLKYLQDY